MESVETIPCQRTKCELVGAPLKRRQEPPHFHRFFVDSVYHQKLR